MPSYHNRPLYVTAFVYDMKLSALIDLEIFFEHQSYINEAVGNLRGRIVEQTIEVLGFGGSASVNHASTNIDLTMKPI